MSKAIEFTAFGTPVGQPRARACIRGKHAGVYDPGTAEGWKNAVRFAAKEAWKSGVPLIGPLVVMIKCRMPRPKKHMRTNGNLKDNAPRWHTGKPDCDNLAKAILDALTTIGIWADDARVAELHVSKIYLTTPIGPHAIIRIEELTE